MNQNLYTQAGGETIGVASEGNGIRLSIDGKYAAAATLSEDEAAELLAMLIRQNVRLNHDAKRMLDRDARLWAGMVKP